MKAAYFIFPLLLLTGCSNSLSKKECKDIIFLTQEVSEASSRYRNTTKSSDIIEMANIFENLGDELSSLHLKDEYLDLIRGELAIVYYQNSKASRQMIESLSKKNIDSAKRSQSLAEGAGKKEQAIIEAINKYCHSL